MAKKDTKHTNKSREKTALNIALYDIALLILIPYNFIILAGLSFLILLISPYWVLIIPTFGLMLGWLNSRLILKTQVDLNRYVNVGAIDLALILPISLFLFITLLPKLNIGWLNFGSVNALYPTLLYYFCFNIPFTWQISKNKNKHNFAINYLVGISLLVIGMSVVYFLVNKTIP